MTTNAQIGNQKIQWIEIESRKKANNAILKLINENIIAELEKKRSPIRIYNTLKYKLLQSKNAKIDIYNAEHQKASLRKKRRKQRYTA